MADDAANANAGAEGGSPRVLTGIYPGLKLGANRYTLLKRLGRGGGGEVWLATDSVLSEPVALKLLSASADVAAAAFEDLRLETRRSRRLSHPNILRIYDFHNLPGEPAFISMEYVKGVNLGVVRQRQPGGVLTWEFLRPIFRELCAALSYAHAEGVIHRDLKPGNFLLNEKGQLKLADFGIATNPRDATKGEAHRHLGWGTRSFMSPQQLDGFAPGTSDDIYSLGATLYELLTGTPPFAEDDSEEKIRHTAPPPMSERLRAAGLTNEIPPGINSLVQECLAKDPARRPMTAREVQSRFENTVVMPGVASVPGAPVTPAPITPIVPPQPAPAASVAASVAAPKPPPKPALTLHKSRPAGAKPDTEANYTFVSGTARPPKQGLIPVGGLLLALAVFAGWWFVRDVRKPQTNAAVAPVIRLPPLTNATLTLVRSFEDTKEPFTTVAVSLDGSRILAGSEDRAARVFEVATGKSKRFVGEGGLWDAAAISPDGESLASGGVNGAVKVWETERRRLRFTLPTHTNGVACVAFSRDGAWLASGGHDGRIIVSQMATGRSFPAWLAHAAPVQAVAFARADGSLASADRDGVARVWNPQTGARLGEFVLGTNRSELVSFSPDGSLLIAGGGVSATVWDVRHRVLVRKLTPPPEAFLTSAAVFADGLVAGGDTTGNIGLWEAGGGKLLGTFVAHTQAVRALSFSDDGQHLASVGADRVVKVWKRDSVPAVER